MRAVNFTAIVVNKLTGRAAGCEANLWPNYEVKTLTLIAYRTTLLTQSVLWPEWRK